MNDDDERARQRDSDRQSEWNALAQRCSEQSAEWERVRSQLHALADDAVASRVRVRADDELLEAFEEATEVRRPNMGALGALSMLMKG